MSPVVLGVLWSITLTSIWQWAKERRKVYVVNHEDYYYEIHVVQGKTHTWVTIPCQHLPWLIELLEVCNKKHPVELYFKSNGGAAHDLDLTVPPWANRKLLKQLRREMRIWQPRWVDTPVAGPYR